MITGKMEKLNTRIATLSMHSPPRATFVVATTRHPTHCLSLSLMDSRHDSRLRVPGRRAHAHHADLGVSGRQAPVL
jgi:hypothetical protein